MRERATSASVNFAGSALDLRGPSVARGMRFQKCPEPGGENANLNSSPSSGSYILRIIWSSLHEKYAYLCARSQTLKSVLEREANKPVAKKLRRSLRLNKSAKRKGYDYFMSDEDKRRLDEYTHRFSCRMARLDIPFECQTAYT